MIAFFAKRHARRDCTIFRAEFYRRLGLLRGVVAGVSIWTAAFTVEVKGDTLPLIVASVNEARSADLYRGWPLLLEVGLLHPASFDADPGPLLIDMGSGPWSDAVHLDITDSNGQVQVWPLALFNVTSNSLTLDGNTAGQLIYYLTPAQTALLSPGSYTIEVALNTTNSPNPQAWKGMVGSVPVELTILDEPPTLSADQRESKQQILASYHLLVDDPSQANADIDDLLASKPDSIAGLSFKSYLSQLAGQNGEAERLLSSAIDIVYATFPDAEEPPFELIHARNQISKLLVAGPSVIRGRYIFYHNSYFSPNAPAAVGGDDGAIATDKSPLLPGQTATFANYTSYSRGINGIIVDIANLPGVPTPSDFTFKVGNDSNPSAWATAPVPSAITVRPGAGADGSDRVSLVWADNAIQRQWLQIAVNATLTTGLESPDVFYFGNAIGDAGNSLTDAKVNATDEILARNNSRASGQAPVDFRYDYNRDGKVNATDEIIARNNATSSLTALQLVNVPPVISGAAKSAVGSASRQLTAAFSPPVIHTVRIEGDGRLRIRFGGRSGHSYMVEGVENLARPAWVKLVPQPSLSQSGDGYEFVVDLEHGNPMRFYRILMR